MVAWEDLEENMITPAQYRQLLKNCGLDTFNWLAYGIIMFMVVPLALLSFHLLILGQFIPTDAYTAYISLRYADPNIATMFLSNFAHMRGDGMSHLIQNVISWELTIATIFAMFLFLIPALKHKYPESGIKFDSKVLVWSTILYFVIVPFAVSGVSILFGNYLGIMGGLGFSGIAYAFCGYMIYIGSEIIEEKSRIKKIEGNMRFYYSGIIVANMLPFWMLATIVVEYLTTPGSGIYGHITGFSLGLVIPAVLSIVISKARGREVGSFK